ncbi:EF-hand domain-containing protein [Streptomyces roseus]|uniref:EF-hand domain-containing protein n=1 Tax=Streptomyces TaxID=1883 RepID=UPI003674EDE6
MATDPLEIKRGIFFDALAGNNPEVMFDNLQSPFVFIAEKYGLPEDGPKARALAAAVEAAWEELLKYANPGGDSLNRDRFDQAMLMAPADETSRAVLAGSLPDAVFDIVDTTGSGFLDKDEFTRFAMALTGDESGALAAFTRMDSDGDGRVSRGEFSRSVDEFLFSPVPDSPGGVIFGIL